MVVISMVRVRYSFSSRRTGRIKNITKQRETFPKLLKDVIETSDIVLEVLDARFIEETRNLVIEKMVEKRDKRLIYVINKADLVDLKKLKSSVGKLGLGFRNVVYVSCKTGQGAAGLREKIKIEVKRFQKAQKARVAKEKDERPEESFKNRVQIGIIGYPNTGKSTLINLITRRGVTRTANQAGYTKGIQKIRFLKDVLILDSPGVIPEEEYTTTKTEALVKYAKLGARTYTDVKDPENVVYSIFEEYGDILKNFYSVYKDDFDDFINQIGRDKKFLVSGGKIDMDRTARIILRDWQNGKIRIK